MATHCAAVLCQSTASNNRIIWCPERCQWSPQGNQRQTGTWRTFLNSTQGLDLEENDLSAQDAHVACSWKRELLGLFQLSPQFYNNCWIKMKWKGWSVRVNKITWPADLMEFPQIVYRIWETLGSNWIFFKNFFWFRSNPEYLNPFINYGIIWGKNQY
jgi:hypothetical protein